MAVGMTRIEALRKRLAAATPGKWTANDIHEIFGEGRSIGQAWGPHEAALIAHAPQDLRDLLHVYDMAKLLFAGTDTEFGNYTKEDRRRLQLLHDALSTLDSPVGDEGAER